jgi:hypothetical protein
VRWTLLTAVFLFTGCGTAAREPAGVSALREAAEPQEAALDWRESYGDGARRLRFEVASLAVRQDGWTAQIAIENSTGIPFELGKRPLTLRFGLMLFADGRQETLDEANRAGELPPLREAVTIEPPPPDVLAPGERWESTLAAPGALADGSHVRVTFGTLVAVGEPPGEMMPTVIWITDRSYRL